MPESAVTNAASYTTQWDAIEPVALHIGIHHFTLELTNSNLKCVSH
jgi:hypothetical protein